MGFAVAASSRIVCVVMSTIALPAKVNLEANSRAALAAGAGHVREKKRAHTAFAKSFSWASCRM